MYHHTMPLLRSQERDFTKIDVNITLFRLDQETPGRMLIEIVPGTCYKQESFAKFWKRLLALVRESLKVRVEVVPEI